VQPRSPQPNAEKPFFRPLVRVLIGVGFVVLIPLCWASGSSNHDVVHTVELCAILGAVFGVLVASNDVAAAIGDGLVTVRNPLVVIRVPYGLIEDVQFAGGLLLRVRGRRTRLYVSGASGRARSGRARRQEFADDLRAQIAQQATASDEASLHVRMKKTWLVVLPVTIAVYIGVGLLAHALK
jgi:hypothetical protein